MQARASEYFLEKIRMTASAFIKTQHPGASASPTEDNVRYYASLGWHIQEKKNGRNTQIHISEDSIEFFTRHGLKHSMKISEKIRETLWRFFKPLKGVTVLEGEYVPAENRIYLFDIIKKDDQLFHNLTYGERHEILKKDCPDIMDSSLRILPLLSIQKAIEILLGKNKAEGLVFKSHVGKGFADYYIIRCRKKN